MSSYRKTCLGSSYHRALLPRIKEYLASNGDSIVDIEKMALDLQARHSEYSRKKRVPFQRLVGLVYNSHKREMNAGGQKQPSRLVGGEGPEEAWLVQREMEHLKKSRKAFDQASGESAIDGERETSSSDSEEEPQQPSFNILNNSLVEVYRSERDATDMASVLPPLVEESLEMDDDKSSGKSCDSHMITSEATPLAGCVRLPSLPDAPSLDESSLSYDSVAAAGLEGVSDMSDSATTKKVSFSTPEVTSQHDYVVFEDNRMRKVKKRKNRKDEDNESSKSKRKKREEETSLDIPLKQSKGSEFAVVSSAVRLSDVGGCWDCLERINKLLLHMKHSELFIRLGVRPPQGFLLHGPPGCGKTLIANAIAGELGLPFIKLAATEVVSGVSGESEGTLRDLFQLTKDHAPCVLFIDEVDAICQKRETAQREMERRIVTQLLACLDDLNMSPHGARVLVIGATSHPDSLDPALRRAGRFDREISIGIPDLKARLSILQVLCRGLCLEEGFDFSLVAEQSPGYVGADLMALVTEASLVAINRILNSSIKQREGEREGGEEKQNDSPGEPGGCGLSGVGGSGRQAKGTGLVDSVKVLSQQQLEESFISTADFLEALKYVQPSAKREGFATVPNTTWSDIGALHEVREELSMAILAPVRYPDHFASLGLSSPPGILLAGPPGCGKTLLAKAIANESGINFISVKGPELLNMYVGESERAVRQVFQRARNSSPCVIFFDELDALCPRRSDMAETSASARVVNQLLTEMDGLETRRQVFIMAATNRPDIIDPAVLRPGRLDKILYVGLPSPSDRSAILNTITKGGQRPRLASDVDLGTIATDKYTKGFSGADLTALVREASLNALKDHMSLNPLLLTSPHTSPPPSSATACTTQPGECIVYMRHFLGALERTGPSVSLKDQEFYQQMSERFSHFSSHQN